MSVSSGNAQPPQAIQGSAKTNGAGGERSEGLDDRMLEEVESATSGGRGKEEDYVEGH